jgi:hypothetical protein
MVMTFEVSPRPNQRMKSGKSADFGIYGGDEGIDCIFDGAKPSHQKPQCNPQQRAVDEALKHSMETHGDSPRQATVDG